MRDLDELLDPTVSRRASDAARTPDFALVERRGQQRRRRARAMAVGAVVAVVAAASVVGTQVASQRSDTAPAGTIEYEGPDGELAQAIEERHVQVDGIAVGIDESELTIWHGAVPGHGLQSGFTLSNDGETRWSGLFYKLTATPLEDGGYVVVADAAGDRLESYLADEEGMRPLELVSSPADLSGGDYEGLVELQGDNEHSKPWVYAIDSDTATAARVVEFSTVRALSVASPAFRQTDDGDTWAVVRAGRRTEFVQVTADGQVRRYQLPAGASPGRWFGSIAAATISRDGRPVMVWQGYDLMVSTVTDGHLATYRYPDRLLNEWVASSVAELPDGRLLILSENVLLRSTDASWRSVERLTDLDPVSGRVLRGHALREVGDEACLVPAEPYTGADTESYCTTDGEAWEPIDLTP